MNAVDTSTLEKALANAKQALLLWEKHRTGEFATTARNSVILEFEICFGQISSPVRRCLTTLETLDPEIVQTMSFTALMRAAAEHGYTRRDVAQWDEFRKDRNLAAHAYSEERANGIAEGVPVFVVAVEELLAVMKQKQEAA